MATETGSITSMCLYDSIYGIHLSAPTPSSTNTSQIIADITLGVGIDINGGPFECGSSLGGMALEDETQEFVHMPQLPKGDLKRAQDSTGLTIIR